ncbi:MAG: DNA polymerase/3'-5' exonuclease PolX [Methanomassiliicoccales archaeon]|jgi:DNA polymerase (family 10)|nr:DNA polymerase/3'-5' exonuclease PolX [Methanomassiliicoccales archaeon]
MRNSEVASALYEVADLLELKGVAFKPNAYRKAARSIEEMKLELSDFRKTSNLRDIPGVGEAIAKKVEELLDTGRLRYLDELKEELPAGLLQLMDVPDIGPKTAMHLYKELRVTNLDELRAAAASHQIRDLKGFGPKSEERILQGIALLERRSGRMLLGQAYPIAEAIRAYLAGRAALELISVGGSLRRMKETIGDIDLLAGSDDPGAVMDVFASYPRAEELLERGPTKAVLRLKDGTQVDLRVVAVKQYGAALQYFTGNKEHNVVLRSMASERGMKLNEYGLFKKDTGEVVASEREEDIYEALGLRIMPPEMRENRGEIEASRRGKLPRLVEMADIRGDFHAHTLASDGSATIEEMAYAAKGKGYEYLGITDHSQSLKVANGLTVDRLRGNMDIARHISERVEGVQVLIGAEVEVLGDGKLDYPDDVLEELDYVIGAVHTKFSMGEREMTERLLTALSNERLTILAHPTGRVLEQREPYAFDMDRVMRAAKDNEVCLELNAFPERLDLSDVNCRRAKEGGVRVAIGTDSHSVAQLDYMLYGVATARRGWLEKRDVLNCLPLPDLVDFLSR